MGVWPLDGRCNGFALDMETYIAIRFTLSPLEPVQVNAEKD